MAVSPRWQFSLISWSDLEKLILALSRKINQKSFDEIVAISRGGLIVGRVLSDFLSLPLSLFAIEAYSGVNARKKPRITAELTREIKNKRILLVDEIVDSGLTLKIALAYLKRLHPKKLESAAVFLKPAAIIKPDFYSQETRDWVIFPYENRETIDNLKKIWQKEGLTKSTIRKKLRATGISTALIKEFFS